MENLIQIEKIVKRDGQIVDFNPEKITFAIFKALRAVGQPDRTKAEKYAKLVVEKTQIIVFGPHTCRGGDSGSGRTNLV
jgi:hypothetical protein